MYDQPTNRVRFFKSVLGSRSQIGFGFGLGEQVEIPEELQAIGVSEKAGGWRGGILLCGAVVEDDNIIEVDGVAIKARDTTPFVGKDKDAFSLRIEQVMSLNSSEKPFSMIVDFDGLGGFKRASIHKGEDNMLGWTPENGCEGYLDVVEGGKIGKVRDFTGSTQWKDIEELAVCLMGAIAESLAAGKGTRAV